MSRERNGAGGGSSVGSDQNIDNKSSVYTGHQKFVVILASLFVAHVVASNHTSIAKVILCLTGQSLRSDIVAAMSLNVIYFFACISICLGAFAATRRWINPEGVVSTLFLAIFIACLAIVDHMLPVDCANRASGHFRITEKVYYLGWILALWVSPFILLCRQIGTSQKELWGIGGLVYVSVGMSLAGFATGLLVEQIVHVMDRFYPHLVKDSQAFWIARPITINAIGCGCTAPDFLDR